MALYKMDSLNSTSMITSICTAGAKAGAWSSSGHRVCEEQQGDKAHGGCMPVCHSSAQAIESVLPRSRRFSVLFFVGPSSEGIVQPNMGRKDVGFTAVTTGRFDELHIEIGNLDNGRQTEMRSSFSGGTRRPGVRHADHGAQHTDARRPRCPGQY